MSIQKYVSRLLIQDSCSGSFCTPGAFGAWGFTIFSWTSKAKRVQIFKPSRSKSAFGVPKGVRSFQENSLKGMFKMDKKRQNQSICFFHICFMYRCLFFFRDFFFRLIYVHERLSTYCCFFGWIFLHHSRLEQWNVPPLRKTTPSLWTGQLHRNQTSPSRKSPLRMQWKVTHGNHGSGTFIPTVWWRLGKLQHSPGTYPRLWTTCLWFGNTFIIFHICMLGYPGVCWPGVCWSLAQPKTVDQLCCAACSHKFY